MTAGKALLGVAVIVIVAACGTPSNDVQITVKVGTGEGPGTFTAEGDSICPDGTITTVDFALAENGATFRDLYACADGSGTFFVGGEVETTAGSTSYTGTWEVEEGRGTGDYQDTTGSGTLAGETEPEWVVEYVGEFG